MLLPLLSCVGQQAASHASGRYVSCRLRPPRRRPRVGCPAVFPPHPTAQAAPAQRIFTMRQRLAPPTPSCCATAATARPTKGAAQARLRRRRRQWRATGAGAAVRWRLGGGKQVPELRRRQRQWHAWPHRCALAPRLVAAVGQECTGCGGGGGGSGPLSPHRHPLPALYGDCLAVDIESVGVALGARACGGTKHIRVVPEHVRMAAFPAPSLLPSRICISAVPLPQV